MWECYICGERFEEPETTSYVEDMDGEQHYQKFWVKCCPRCGAEDIEETEVQDEDA